MSFLMYDMEHRYVIYRNHTVALWDVCEVLLSENITEYQS